MFQKTITDAFQTFKNNSFYSQIADKQNRRDNYYDVNRCFSEKQNKESSNLVIKKLEKNIEKLITDGNKIINYFVTKQEEHREQIQQMKEQFSISRNIMQQQKNQLQTTLQETKDKILELKKEVLAKQQKYIEAFDKYELLEETTQEQSLKQKEQTLTCQTVLIQETEKHQAQIMKTMQELQNFRSECVVLESQNKSLHEQISYLRSINDELLYENQSFKQALQTKMSHDSTQYLEQSLAQLQRIELQSLGRQSFRTLENMGYAHSSESLKEKDCLNISQHYSKFNYTNGDSKEKNRQWFCQGESNESKEHILLNYGSVEQKRLMEMGSVERQDKNIHPKSSAKQSIIKEFKVKQVGETPTPSEINIYRAFFTLLVQSQKLNSRYFQNILSLDLGYLYDELVEKGVTYNKWQQHIKKQMEKKFGCKLK